MPDMKGITVKIPADLHAELKAYIEAHGMTTGEFIAQAVDNELHPKIQIKEEQPMENMRTLAFQVPESLFQRVKAYLERNHMTQKQFVIGLIEAELEQDEALYQSEQTEEQEDEEESDDQTEDEEAEEELQTESNPQEGQEGPGAGLEEQPAPDQDTASVDGFEAGSEDGEAQPETEEETEEQDEEEILEDSGSVELVEEQEEQSYQPGMAW